MVRYVVLPSAEVDRGLLEDATRRGSFFFFFVYRVGIAGVADRFVVGEM